MFQMNVEQNKSVPHFSVRAECGWISYASSPGNNPGSVAIDQSIRRFPIRAFNSGLVACSPRQGQDLKNIPIVTFEGSEQFRMKSFMRTFDCGYI
jgi:hypothetical protein